jgi:hypothetical protein
MTFRHILLSAPVACAALHRGRRKLRARVSALQATADAEFIRQFPALVAAVESGYRHEEALLELLGEACLHPRRADHAIILCALHRTMSRVEGGDVIQGRQVVDALGHVLGLPWPLFPPAPVPRHLSPATHRS